MTGAELRCTVVIPSHGRPEALRRCLQGLASQTLLPAEVLVVWQDGDTGTRDLVDTIAASAPYRLRSIGCPERGIVPAENRGLANAEGDVICMTDDDAIPPPAWVEKHMRHYRDESVGAVGGPVRNFDPSGAARPPRHANRIGQITWYGKFAGNMFDHPEEWSTRQPIEVRHLAGGNMSLRRKAFARFEESLKPYWAMFEADACLQVQANGYRVVYDFSNTVRHFPTNSETIYSSDRGGDLTIKVLNPAFNHAFILAKHSPWWLQAPRLIFEFGAGTRMAPGMAGWLLSSARFGHPLREFGILIKASRARLSGWSSGLMARSRKLRPAS